MMRWFIVLIGVIATVKYAYLIRCYVIYLLEKNHNA